MSPFQQRMSPPIPQKLVVHFWFMEGGGGGAAIINQGVGAGPGSPARSTSRTSRREPIKIGTLLGGKYYHCH